MRLAYLDCFAGASGDMFLGALTGAGVPLSVLQEATTALGLGASLVFETVDRSGISATKAHVMVGGTVADAPGQSSTGQDEPLVLLTETQRRAHVHPHLHPHPKHETITELQAADLPEIHGRSLTEIRSLIQASALADPVQELALKTFDLLGHAEARIHNVPVDEIHFHEVGAIDAIVDIVATCAGIVHLQIDAWHCSPVNVGGGTVRCAHGVFPVPAPATADLLRGAPTYSAHMQKELVTPTGAALLRALSPTFGAQPTAVVTSIGYGAGSRNPVGFANVLRLSIGTSAELDAAQLTTGKAAARDCFRQTGHSSETVAVLEAALDDATPQLLAYVAEQALQQGALDVMLTPMIMKKGRPGTLITVLANPGDTQRFEYLLLRETTTLGVRVREERRVCLQRDHISVETPFGRVRVKTGSMGEKTLNAMPEYEDCKRLAEEHDIPLKRVQAAAMTAYAQFLQEKVTA